jgi:hypothetical protein
MCTQDIVIVTESDRTTVLNLLEGIGANLLTQPITRLLLRKLAVLGQLERLIGCVSLESPVSLNELIDSEYPFLHDEPTSEIASHVNTPSSLQLLSRI